MDKKKIGVMGHAEMHLFRINPCTFMHFGYGFRNSNADIGCSWQLRFGSRRFVPIRIQFLVAGWGYGGVWFDFGLSG
jgi:hypothetical protein